jgi:hypothetical protein
VVGSAQDLRGVVERRVDQLLVDVALDALGRAAGRAHGPFKPRGVPGFYGSISQLLPPGAALTAVRNVEYFDWAATLAPLLVLGAWAFGGLLVGLLGERYGPHVRRSAMPVSASRMMRSATSAE